MALAETIVVCLGVYFGAGVIVAILFLSLGVSRIDHAAKGASPFFRNGVSRLCRAMALYHLATSVFEENQPACHCPAR